MSKPKVKCHDLQHDCTFNFWIGCQKFTEGCQNCYMHIAQERRHINPEKVRRVNYDDELGTWPKPLRWQKEAERAGLFGSEYRSVFACSYSDFFLLEADDWRDEAWELIRKTPNLNYRISTKRTRRILDHLPKDWGDGYKNVWLGTAVELKKRLDRLDDLRKIPCVLRYVDLAPMLEDLMPELAEHLDGIGWVVASGETGCGYVDPRPYDEQWARNVRDFCVSKGIPFFYSHTAGRRRYPPRLLDGREWNEVPTIYYNGP